MSEITIEEKYDTALDMLSDFVGQLLGIEEFCTKERVDTQITYILENPDLTPEELYGLAQQSGVRH